MPRTWASGDNVFLPIGGLVGIGSSPNTLVAIAKRASDGAWMTPTAIQPSAGNPTVSMQVSSTNKLSYVSGATDKDTGITWQASDGWSLIAVDKAGGTATPNGHLYVYSTNTWTHSAAASTVGGNSTDLTGGKVQHGRWATGDPFIGDIAIAGIWKRQLAQAEIEYLAFSLQTWFASAPDYLVIFDQAATSQNVIDLITGNTEQSHSGAAIGTSSLPVFSYGFTESVTGHAAGGAAPVTLGQAVETDTATTLARSKSRGLGQASETDTATAVTRSKTRTLTQALETDTATTLSRFKLRTLTQAAETDTATALGRSKLRLIGQSVEADTATSLGRSKLRLIGQANESDTASQLTVGGVVVLGQAVETSTATALSRGKRLAVGQALEVDTAGTVGPVGGGAVIRPFTGTVTRPNTGLVVRPFTGIVTRP